MCPLYRDWISVAVLIAYSDSFLLALLGPNYIRAHPVFLSWDGYSKHCGASRQRHTHGGEDIEILLLLWSSFFCSICGLWSVVSLYVGLFMFDYFVESHGGVKGDEQCHVAIRVDKEPICCDVGAVPGRSVAMCGDPQDHITNGCDFRQCKSGKNRLFCSEKCEQVTRVLVHCKLGTRATQLGAYRQRRGGVKSSLSRRGDPILSSADYVVVCERDSEGEKNADSQQSHYITDPRGSGVAL